MALLGYMTPLHGGDSIPLTARVLTIGRADGCDVVVRHRSISSQHCRLTYLGSAWGVEDLESRHGTFVGQKRCRKVRVKSGAVLRIGAVRFELTAVQQKSNPADASVDEDLASELLGEQAGSTAKSPPEVTPTRLKSRVAKDKAAENRQSVDQKKPVKNDSSSTVPTTPKATKQVRRFLGKLTPQAGGNPIALMDEQIVIGRGRECGIRLKYSTISTEHCRLRFHEGHWSVCDLDSRNGIRINSQPTSEDWLMPGDILSLGKLRFEIDYQPRSAEPPPAFDVTAGKSLIDKAGLTKALESDDTPGWLVTDQDPEPEQRIDLESL